MFSTNMLMYLKSGIKNNNNKSHRTLFFGTVYCFESLVENCNKNLIEGTPITEVKPNNVCLQVLLKAFFCSFTKF